MDLEPGLHELKSDPIVVSLCQRPDLRVVVSGWSASGKSVFSRYVAALLGCEYVCASSLLTSDLGLESVDWIADRTQMESLRSSEKEMKLDDLLLDVLRDTPRIILDSWVAPFRSTVHDVAVWIECDLATRVRNVLKVQAIRGSRNVEETRYALLLKDRDSVRRFRESYGFDFGPNPAVFPVRLDISGDITADSAHWPSERRKVVGDIVHAVSRYLGGQSAR
ncbi:hypothetical protein [Mycobacterium sp. SP-6446]|uniref:hypothetical protein n=1 Tax=Mycobacterium sp. SP-6446 TaxID=1834162 RepID=UPI00111561BA|nr:hypothetical protein [Mycobacterium sp. SP-6446]